MGMSLPTLAMPSLSNPGGGDSYSAEAIAYFNRVESDGGQIYDKSKTNLLINYLKNNTLLSICDAAILPYGGIKLSSGNVTKAYSLNGAANTDFVQSTAANMPLWDSNYITFDGLASPNNDYLNTGNFSKTANESLMIKVTILSRAAADVIIDSVTTQMPIINLSAAGTISVYAAGGYLAGLAQSYTLNVPFEYLYTNNGAAAGSALLITNKNNANKLTDTTPKQTAPLGLYVARQNAVVAAQANYRLHRLLSFARQLSDAEYTGLYDYLVAIGG